MVFDNGNSLETAAGGPGRPGLGRKAREEQGGEDDEDGKNAARSRVLRHGRILRGRISGHGGMSA